MGTYKVRRSRTGRERPGRRIDPGWYVIGGILAIGLAVMTIVIRNQTRATVPPPARAEVVAAELADPRVDEVARRFLCPCGRCGGMELVDCTCDTPGGALEMKAVIAELLRQGLDVEATVAAVASRYGPPKGAAAESTPGHDGPSPTPALAQVSEADVLVVASRFPCPCGECTDGLVTCDCDHPRGARAVKRFIRERLREGLSVDQAAAAVEREFGHRT